MCYAVRHHITPQESSAPQSQPQDAGGTRPRWTGAAVAAALIGGVALASAYVSPSHDSQPAPTRSAAAPAAVTGPATQEIIRATLGGAAPSLPADDDVPTAPDTTRAMAGPCQHGM